MILSHSKFITTHESNLDSDCEIVWSKIALANCKPLYHGSFYRQPNNNNHALEQLEESLHKIPREKGFANIILSGDFNLPSLTWDEDNYSAKNQPIYGATVNNKMLEIVEEYNFGQTVKEPTREENILDIFLTTSPDLIHSTQVIDGMGDHQAVICDVNTQARINKKPPRTIYLYDKANNEQLRKELRDHYRTFKETYTKRTVDENWNSFKNTLDQTMSKNIPTKTLSSRTHVPWMTYHIRRKLRIKQRRYNKAKRTNKETDWAAFKQARRDTKECLEKSHTEYVMNLLKTSDDQPRTNITKNFWRYIKNQKKDNCGVAPLTYNGETYENNKDKANILNKQFQSVFTDEDTTRMSKLRDKDLLPTIQNLSISTAGVENY